MKGVLFFWFGFFAFVVSVKAQESRNFYLWNKSAVQLGLNDKLRLKVSTKTHYLASSGMRDMSYLDLNLSRRINNWLELGVALRGAQVISIDHELFESRPQLISTISFLKYQIKYHTTNRIAYRFFNKQDGHFRYYHNIFFDFPSFAGLIPEIYIGEELFTKLNDSGLHLARFYGGIHAWETNLLSLDLYYVWQKSKEEKSWMGADILGVNLTFSI